LLGHYFSFLLAFGYYINCTVQNDALFKLFEDDFIIAKVVESASKNDVRNSAASSFFK